MTVDGKPALDLFFVVMQDPKIVRKRIGEHVRYLREKKGWSQFALSQKAGLGKSYTGAVERGEVEICVGTVCKLALAFDIRLAELWEGADDWSPRSRPQVTGHKLQAKTKTKPLRQSARKEKSSAVKQ